MKHKVELVAFELYGYIWTNENARMLTNDMGVNLRIIGGQIMHEKISFKCICLGFLGAYE